MTIDSMFFVKPWHDNKFIKKYGMPIPKNFLYLSPNIYHPHIFIFKTIDKLDNQYRQNY